MFIYYLHKDYVALIYVLEYEITGKKNPKEPPKFESHIP